MNRIQKFFNCTKGYSVKSEFPYHSPIQSLRQPLAGTFYYFKPGEQFHKTCEKSKEVFNAEGPGPGARA